MSEPRPTLVYDGECAVCRRWVAYWQRLTDARVLYRPYQEAAADFPAIPASEFAQAIWLVEPGGGRHSGAAATYRVLSYAPGHGGWWWLYRHVPGFAPVSERAYAFFARRRDLLALITRLTWGSVLEPPRYELVSWVFLRGLGVIYVAAFGSLAIQILGLIGEAGILPLGDYLSTARRDWGPAAYWRMPTLFWFNSSDQTLIGVTLGGVALGSLIVLDRGVRPALIGAFVLYLSLVYAGQVFLNFQWDQLLLEAGFLAIFLTSGAPIVVWLYRCLLFRFLFLAGLMKLLSGDPTWPSLTALHYHFWTQPLPAPLAWPAAQLPHLVLAAATAVVLVIELGLAFMVFLPRRPRVLAAACILLFQLAIVLTGNYGFFNLLTMLLCVFLFDDAALSRLMPRHLAERIRGDAPKPGRSARTAAALLAFIVVPVGIDRMWQPLTGGSLPLIGAMTSALSPLQIVNPYGLFVTVTTKRPEIIIEGSEDGRTWRQYVFRYKPGPVDRPPGWNIPHQPRLDWQMWFAAYRSTADDPWVERLVVRLLEGSAAVRALLATDPFPERPPNFIRAQLYDYRFAHGIEAPAGQWWIGQLDGFHLPPVSLADFARGTAPSPVDVPPLPGIRPRPQ
jgi:predicted DCC family thiol-disulfide oxidoreductase YuxK